MAKGLEALIRLQRFKIDEKRRQLGELMRQADELHEEARRLEEELREEQAVAADSLDAAMTYGGFARAVIERRERLAEAIARCEQEIARTREELADVYRELKSYEVAHAARLAREAEERARVENARLDEIGIEGFRRKQRENA